MTPAIPDDPVVTSDLTPDLTSLRAAGVLEDADLHVTDAVARLTGTDDPAVLLAIALTVRAPRLGHVCLDLPRVHAVGLAADTGERVEVELPEPVAWQAALRASAAVRAPGEDGRPPTPLVLDGHRLYLDRYWRYEQRLVRRLHELVAAAPTDRDPGAVAEVLDQLFPDPDDAVQRQAAEVAAARGLTVLTGGPGTGKTTTVVRLLAALWLTAAPGSAPQVVLAAPTGKAAARMAEAVRGSVATLPIPPELRTELEQLPALTVHRLLGYQPGAPTRFRRDANDPLPHDVVVLDEASMASLPLMAKLVAALRPDARLVLVGDRDQLASVDAGAVLSDICGPQPVSADPGEAGVSDPPGGGREATGSASEPIAQTIVRLTRFHRFGADSGIGAVARAIQRVPEGTVPGAADEVLALLRGERTEPGGPDRYLDVQLIPPADAGPMPPEVSATAVDRYEEAVRAAIEGAPPEEVLVAFERSRVLAALRHGPDGVRTLDRVIATELGRRIPAFEPDAHVPLGQPLMVTRNDQRVGLFNGDVGVVVRDPQVPDRRRIAFPAPAGEVRLLAPARVPEAESVFAMSIHKAQGSQFDRVVVVLPRTDVPLLTRELVYTGITRAAEHVTVVADDDVLVRALGRRVQRASGLTERLWHPAGSSEGM